MAENPALNKHGACSLLCIRRKMAFLVPTLLGYIDKTKKQIFHTDKGKMVALNFAKDGYMVTMIEDKETTCVYDGNCLPSWE